MPTGKLTLGQMEATLNRTYQAISRELERRATVALWKLAKTHPGSEVRFCSAMGSYLFDFSTNMVRGGWRDVKPPVLRTFDRMWSDYGNNVIPAPVFLKIRDGKLTRLTHW